MKKGSLFMLVLFGLTILTFAQKGDEMGIRNVLAKQTTEWNKGNIPGFMETYWKSDSLMFIGKSGVTYGWQKTMNNYIKNYPDTIAMGKLDFDLLELKRLSADYYFVVGKWYLTRTIGNIGGLFTLLFRKIGNKWFIVADHSS